MHLDHFTTKNLKNISNIKLQPFNFSNLLKLKNISIPIIKSILDNFSYTLINKKEIKSIFREDILVDMIKSSKINNENKHYNFIDNVKNNKVNLENIFDYINFNNDITNYLNFNSLGNILKEYPSNILSKFVPPEIFYDILKNLLHKSVYNIKYKTNTLKFTIYSKGNFSNFSKVILFLKGLYLLEIYNLKNINLSINIFLSNIKKTFKSIDYLGPREINSGLTSFSLFSEPEICIFRSEEVDKLLLHELTHATFKDQSLKGIDEIESKVKCLFNVNKNNKINIFEAYTESMALVCNSIFNSIFSGIPIYTIFSNEIKFTIYQCSKILQFYNIKDINKFFCHDCCFLGNDNHIEKTSVLSYFFLKLGLIYDIDKFIKQYFYANIIKSIDLLIDIKINFSNLKHLFIKEKINDSSLRMTLYTFIWDIDL